MLCQGNVAVLAHSFHSKRRFATCIILTRQSGYKSGSAMWVAKLIKEDCYSNTFELYATFKTKALEY